MKIPPTISGADLTHFLVTSQSLIVAYSIIPL